jgi:hypothetical protein
MKAASKTTAYTLALTAAVLLTACDSKWKQMPNDELAAKSVECFNLSGPAPAMIQVCKNYKRECERRRENGIYVC